jgi:beta-lactamase class D
LRATPPPAITPRLAIDALPALRAHFEAERVSGTIALYDSATGKLGCSDVALCEQTFIPASTFKIPNALVGLETGVVEDSETIFRWDGKEYPVPDWNQDHTLRTAIRVSCVPCFQSLARSVGSTRMQEWVNRLDYGNHDISGGIDKFWLTGALRISPVQQIDFLRRLDGEKLPVSERTREILLDIIALDVGREHVLRGKTGLQREPEFPGLTGWFVGWVEIGERRIFFATLINRVEPDVDVLAVRRRLTERILRAEGMLPG